MPLRVKLIGDLQRFTDAEIVELAGDGYRLETAIDDLTRRYPRLGREIFDDQGRIHYALILMTGGRRVAWPQEKDAPIEDGGELVLMRFMAGG